ncbi:MAG: glycosyltransferase family 9 protein [Bacteroidales bacterium]|jgi:lipopolysaccharide heptosyltransferase II|nr:glycosyltransferase family 9 protein [Bacteroidales bacterium]
MKILIVRFSSMGDIVLTTPIIRCIAQQIPNAEIHYLCKPAYKNILEINPYIKTIHSFVKDDTDILQGLRNEEFDYVIDLQNNFRSHLLDRKLNITSATFPKLNIQKWILVHLKINKLPNIHLVDRYFMAVKKLIVSVVNDGNGLDFFIDNTDYRKIDAFNIPQPFIAIALGSQHKTKQLPTYKLIEICKKINSTIVLLGGANDMGTANDICIHINKNIVNLCGQLSIRESAVCIERAKMLLTGDTGLMHIAAALNKPLVSVWGNTVPAFGMYPYMPQYPDYYHIVENNHLRCRPCSKLGFDKCPKKHFKCMNDIDINQIVHLLNE